MPKQEIKCVDGFVTVPEEPGLGLVNIYDPSQAYDGCTLFHPLESRDEYLVYMK